MMRLILLLISALLLCSQKTQAEETSINWYGSVLMRHELEDGHFSKEKRDRLRLIAQGGIKYQLSKRWKLTTGLSTGLKNKQNIPAITIARFNQQKLPDRDIYIDRLFAQYNGSSFKASIGKQPWQMVEVTDMFWDRHLKPIGLTLIANTGGTDTLIGAYLKPLDGNSATVGSLMLIQYVKPIDWLGLSWEVSPALVNFTGQEHRIYAKKDTQWDNLLAKIAIKAQNGRYKLGIDYSRSIDSDHTLADYQDQNNALAVELKVGSLKKPGHWLTQIRFFYVQRFGVISEFAQNATSRAATSNFKAIDLRVRRKMSPNWWLGSRFSITQSLKGQTFKDNRFRIEAQYKF